jgi:hypothetical protein
MIIDKNILEKTTKCEKNFKCLDNPKEICCKVEEVIDNKVFFVKCLSYDYCNYKTPYGYSNICSCPTRIEIYRKHKI